MLTSIWCAHFCAKIYFILAIVQNFWFSTFRNSLWRLFLKISVYLRSSIWSFIWFHVAGSTSYLSAFLIVFHWIISLWIAFHCIALSSAFSKWLLENHFLKEQCLEQRVSLPNVFPITRKLTTENISVCCFSATKSLKIRRLLTVRAAVKI